MKDFSVMNVIKARENVALYEKYPYWIYIRIRDVMTDGGPGYMMIITVKFRTQANAERKIKVYYVSDDLNSISQISKMVTEKIWKIITNAYTEKDRARDFGDIYVTVNYFKARTGIIGRINKWSFQNQIRLKYLDLYLLQ